MIFFEIINHVNELVTDPSANCFVQNLLEVCNEDQFMKILRAITRRPGELIRISCDLHGTRVVKKIIETMKTPEQIFCVVARLRSNIVALVRNINGSQVAQHCLQYLRPECNKFIFEAAAANCVNLAKDRHGCSVLIKCLRLSGMERRHQLVCEITSNALSLAQDPYGNYAVQEVLQFPEAVQGILDQLKECYANLSIQKYSSNVVEKCLLYAGDERRDLIIQELLYNPGLYQMMQDPYGNYVIQLAVKLSKGFLHVALVESIRPHASVLQTNPFGRKVLYCINRKK